MSDQSAPPASGGSPFANLGPAIDEAYDIRIKTDGTWLYQGTEIRRPGLVKLFASVLRRDDAGDFWLITPAERGRIRVDDAPFVAVDVTRTGTGPSQVLRFRTNLDEEVEAGPDHPIRVETDPATGEPRPYIVVRDRLEARINRPTFYELVAIAEEEATPADLSRNEADRVPAHRADGTDGGRSPAGPDADGEPDEVAIWSRGSRFRLGSLGDG